VEKGKKPITGNDDNDHHDDVDALDVAAVDEVAVAVADADECKSYNFKTNKFRLQAKKGSPNGRRSRCLQLLAPGKQIKERPSTRLSFRRQLKCNGA